MSSDNSLQEVFESVDPAQKKTRIKRFLAYLGPAYLVAVGYMDPGNWATDIEGGSRYGYSLIWVLLMSNIMALVLQSLCARLGIVYKKDLAQANRHNYPRFINFILYLLAELAIAATDLAEVLGMAIGLQLLFGIPLMYGVIITLVDTFLLLYLQRFGIKGMEAFIIGLISIIFMSFVVLMAISQPSLGEVIKGIKPSLPDNKALFIAIGIIGATVMPHNLYLHSSLVQTRKIGEDNNSIKKAIKYYTIDSAIALNLALFVNAAILILAGTVFHKQGMSEVASISDAHQLLSPLTGSTLAPILFALALIAAGQSSTITGTLSGQIVMEGYLQIRMNPWLRRLITRMIAVVPAVIVILISGEKEVDNLLVFSQVILSVQLPFAVIPLILFVSDKKIMGDFAIKPTMLIASSIIASIIIFLNLKLIFSFANEYIQSSNNGIANTVIVLLLSLFILLLVFTILFPLIRKHKLSKSSTIHKEFNSIHILPEKNINKIAVTLDYSALDNRVINEAILQANFNTEIVLIHVVESASAKIYGDKSNDEESKYDRQQLEIYCNELKAKGYNAIGVLGYRNRVQEIARIVKEYEIELLIIGAHGHQGLMDYIMGETINKVRHLINIPLLVIK